MNGSNYLEIYCSADCEINKRDALSVLAFSGRHRKQSLLVLAQKYTQFYRIKGGGGSGRPPPDNF